MQNTNLTKSAKRQRFFLRLKQQWTLQAFALLPRSGSTAILSMLHLFARETALSCLLLAPVYPALRAVRRAFPD